jgi:cyclic-di-AMP phosphodiesterase PgpH
MTTGKERTPLFREHKHVALLALCALVLCLIIGVSSPFWVAEYREGDIARSNIRAVEDTYVPASDVTVKKGEIVVREGERINAEHLRRLSAFRNTGEEPFLPILKFAALFFLLFLTLTILFEFAERTIKKFTLSQKDLIFCLSFTAFTALFLKVCVVAFQQFAPAYTQNLAYLIPLFFFGMILRVVLFSEIAVIFTIFFAVVAGFILENNFPMALYLFLGNLLTAYFSGRCETRNTILKAGLFTAVIMSFVMVLFKAFLGQQIGDVPLDILFIILSGIGSSFIAMGLLPVIEHVFDYTTDIKLLELANFEHPLLEEMMVKAPGTYHHSIIVGNLSRAAAESIGANPLLARVSAYYHDVGKLKMPHYFVENRTGFDDVHRSLSPNMSALIIQSHVKEGVELADKFRLGRKLKEIIQQHHGTRLVTYFYNKAKELEHPDLHVTEEKDFRYAGPKPQTKEAGIVMLADTVEAASRTLDEPTPKRIETHVEKIIERIFLDGQLDECELTLKDLNAIRKNFITVLLGIFHQRIEYPERTTQPSNGSDKKLSKTA